MGGSKHTGTPKPCILIKFPPIDQPFYHSWEGKFPHLLRLPIWDKHRNRGPGDSVHTSPAMEEIRSREKRRFRQSGILGPSPNDVQISYYHILVVHPTYPIYNQGCNPLTKWDEPQDMIQIETKYHNVSYIHLKKHIVYILIKKINIIVYKIIVCNMYICINGLNTIAIAVIKYMYIYIYIFIVYVRI